MALPAGLLEAVRNRLDITWESVSEDEKLTGIIARGMKRINRIAGESLDYTIEDTPRALLMAYCMYDRANALDDFEKNYLSELLDLQNQKEVERYVKERADI